MDMVICIVKGLGNPLNAGVQMVSYDAKSFGKPSNSVAPFLNKSMTIFGEFQKITKAIREPMLGQICKTKYRKLNTSILLKRRWRLVIHQHVIEKLNVLWRASNTFQWTLRFKKISKKYPMPDDHKNIQVSVLLKPLLLWGFGWALGCARCSFL